MGSAQNDKNNAVDRSSGDNPDDFRNQVLVAAARVCQFRGSPQMLPDKCAGAGKRAAAGFKPSIP